MKTPPVGDHPRACGEHMRADNSTPHNGGSSPRMRGTQPPSAHADQGRRIIPAHAGNTKNMEDYWNTGVGSSPRMRGTLVRVLDRDARIGIIPAHAGNTLNRLTANISIRDHPRACGEHMKFPHLEGVTPGSSPRMRGTLPAARRVEVVVGIIPAHAGNTSCSVFFVSLPRDHPRACGEHADKTGKKALRLGSSPRMRGTQLRRGGIDIIHGIIPAHAGNTKVN